METMTGKAALSVDEAARYLGIGRAHLYRLMDSRRIRGCHIGRRRLLLRSELDRYLAERMEAEHGAEA